MKKTLFLISFSLLIVTAFNLNESGAIVANIAPLQQLKDGTVTGVYQGYKNQTILMLLKDGTRMAYPFKADKSLLGRISKTRLATPVIIDVKNGIVVRFQEVHK